MVIGKSHFSFKSWNIRSNRYDVLDFLIFHHLLWFLFFL